jgi:hypothetical protein
MTLFHSCYKKTGVKTFLAALAIAIVLIPAHAFSAERDGTVLFFSFEDLKQELSKPELPQLPPRFSWRNQSEQPDQTNPIERSYFWGNGLGIDGYAHPGTRQPLWGY